MENDDDDEIMFINVEADRCRIKDDLRLQFVLHVFFRLTIFYPSRKKGKEGNEPQIRKRKRSQPKVKLKYMGA